MNLPSEEQLKDAFLSWLNTERRANYVDTSRPDRVERQKKEIDFILEDKATSAKIALEISTIWRSAKAGKQDAEFTAWVNVFSQTVSGRVPGTYALDVPMTAPGRCDPKRVGEELLRIIPSLVARLAVGRAIPINIQGVGMRLGRIDATGSEALTARMLDRDYQTDLKKDVQQRIDAKAVKLLSYKQRGFETWILVYSTAWPIFAPDDVRKIVSSALGPSYQHVDHVGVWNGSNVASGWMILVR